MSRSKRVIDREPYYDWVEDVYLNRDGVKVGQVVRWIGTRLAYMSWRMKEHWFIKYSGFGVDEALLWDLIDKYRVELIVIRYKGPRGLRLYVSNVDDWVEHGKRVHHTKRVKQRMIGERIETYGKQVILSEDYMDELEVTYG